MQNIVHKCACTFNLKDAFILQFSVYFLDNTTSESPVMTNRVELESSLSRPRGNRAVGAQGRDAAVSYRVGLAILGALACVLAVALLDRISPSARDASADASILYGP
jgi:hypothetical protein